MNRTTRRLLDHLEGVRRCGDGWTALCPAHEDRKPSFSVNEAEDGQVLVHCHAGCPQETVVEALKTIGGWPSGTRLDVSHPTMNRTNQKVILPNVIDEMIRDLNELQRKYLRDKRCLSDAAINRYRIGVKGGRVAIQILDQEGVCRDVRLWLPPERRNQTDQAKILHWAQGYGALRLYPINQVSHAELLLTEGELDALAAISAGIPAITTTGGARSWADSASKPLADKFITILMDHDEAGKEGARKRGDSLVRHGCTVLLARWPDDRAEGWDTTDELVHHGLESLKGIIGSAEPFTEGPVVRLSDVQAEKVQWLWYPYIPLGKLTLLEGDPGLGKSWLTLALAASVSTGAGLPGTDKLKPATALLLSAEDGLADTIKPRLAALEANCESIFALNKPLALAVADGFEELERYVRQYQPKLVIIDPLFAYTGEKVDIHRANEARAITARLSKVAESHRCAIVALRHLRKSESSKAAYRGIGSIDFYAACRSVLLVGSDPGDSFKRVVVHTKHNLTPPGDSLGFCIDQGRFYWTGTSDATAGQVLAADSEEDRSDLDEAKSFLQEVLGSGPKDYQALMRQAKKAGISERTLRRAKRALGAISEKSERKDGPWCWTLPKPQVEDGQLATFSQAPRLSEDPQGEDLGHLQKKKKGKQLIIKDFIEDGHGSSRDGHLYPVATFKNREDGQGGQDCLLKESGHLRGQSSADEDYEEGLI